MCIKWKVKNVEDITTDSLALFTLLEPKLDLLLIGTGDSCYYTSDAITKLRKQFSTLSVPYEIMTTRNAVATYNFMLSDFRIVAGAFLPSINENKNEHEKLLLDNQNKKSELIRN